MALALKDRVKETTIVVGTGAATLLGASIGFQPFSVVGNGNTTYYCISDQFGSNWEVGIGTYSSSGNTLARTTVLASSNAGALVVFTTGVKDVFVTYPSEKGVWLDASNNAIGLGTPAAFVGTNITGTASGLTAGNVTTNANLSGAVSSIGNSTSLGSFTSLQLATALTDETGSGAAVFATSPTLDSPTYTGTLTGSTSILNIGSSQIYKDASGNVGIGTSSPGGILHTFKTSTAAATVGAFIQNNDNTIGTEVRLGFAANTNLLSQDRYGWIGYVNTGGANGGALTFATTPGGTPATERMRIDSSGNVGIGTSSPYSQLDVYSTIASPTLGEASGVGTIRITNGATALTSAGGLEFKNAGDSNGYGAKIQALSSSGTQLVFANRGASTTWVERMRIDSSGNLLVGTTSALSTGSISFVASGAGGAAMLAARNSATAGGKFWTFGPDNGNAFRVFNQTPNGVYVTDGATSWSAFSDERLKTDLIPIANGLEKVNSLRSVTGRFKTDEEGVSRSFLIAQDVQKVLPEAVSVQDDELGTLGVAYTEVIPLLVASIKELKAIIDTQQEQINSLLGK